MPALEPARHDPPDALRIVQPLIAVSLVSCAVALFLALLDGSLGYKLVYSFAIGFACWGITALCRRAGRRLRAAWRRRQGQPADALGAPGWAITGPAVLLGMLLGPALGLAVGDALTGSRSPSVLQWGAVATRFTLAATVLATAVMVVLTAARERAARAQARAQAAQREAAEAQLRLLQSQLEPHMLFNTLANLRVLIGLDPARAQAMLDRLIAYLRATLLASRVDSHPLSAEFDRLGDFLALMAVRMGPRLQTRLDLPEALRDLPVPPLLLQPLVENAIRHGLEPQVAGGRIEVQARLDGPDLCLTVRDTGVGLDPAARAGAGERTGGHGDTAGTGFGLAQVRERLATLHGERARLSLSPSADAEGGTVATLRLPCPARVAPAASPTAPDRP